ncbi:MAG: flagellar hook-length control protein FliK [Bacteroidota bacterium]|nr:flagellar hook-length control protein FliK [Bacteroidota bacterium]
MFFNPLFLQVINSPESLSTAKSQKLNGSSYLFSDIIKVCLDKNDTEGLNMVGSSALSSSTSNFASGMNNIDLVGNSKDVEQIDSAEMTLFKLLGQIFPQKFDLGASKISGTSLQNMGDTSTTNSGDLSNSMLLNENEVTALISRLLSNNFNGKINILSEKTDSNNSSSDEVKKLDASSLTSNDLLDLLKEGKTISLESETDRDNPGLLISLVEVNKAAGLNNPFLTPTLAGANSIIDETKSYSDGNSTVAATSNKAGIIQGNTTSGNNSIDQLSGINPAVSNNKQPQYQIELSFVNNQESNSAPSVFNMFSESTSTTELQDVINSKSIKLPDGSSLNFNKTVNGNAIFQKNAGMSSDTGAQNANGLNLSQNVNPEQGSDSVLTKNINTQSVAANTSEPVPLAESSSIKADADKINNNNTKTAIPNLANTGSEKGAIDLTYVKTGSSQQQSKVEIFGNNSNLNTEQSSSSTTANAAENNSSTNASITGEKIDEPLTANVLSSSGETSDNSEIKASADPLTENEQEVPLTSKEIPASEKTIIETSVDKNITKNNIDINNLQNKKSRIIKDINLSISSSRAQKDAADKEGIVATDKDDTLGAKGKGLNINNLSEPASKGISNNSTKLAGKDVDTSEDKSKTIAEKPADQKSIVKETAQQKGPSEQQNIKQDSKSEQESISLNSEKNDSMKEGNDLGDKAKNNMQQEQQQTASSDKQDFKVKFQESHINSNEQIKLSGNEVKGKTIAENVVNNTPVKTVKAAEVMKEISGFIQKNDSHSITLKIDPESLGSVKIALDVVDKIVHANIEVENEAAKKMVENNLNQLYNSLNQNGVQFSSINISLANHEQKQQKSFNPKRKMFQSEQDGDYDDKSVSDGRKMGYNTYEYLI